MNRRTHCAYLFNYLLILGIPLAFLVVCLGLNSLGFCFTEMRFLSNEDKIQSVFNYQNKRTDLLNIVHVEKSSNRYIKYKNFDEYIKENPNCCKINPGGPYDIPPPSLLYPILGGFPSGDVVVINFKVRYLGENGKQKSEQISFENVVTNCGKVH